MAKSNCIKDSVYIDDGISGTTDDERAGFQKMLADIKAGLINCVIVKDLARSFRNYSDQGYYLDDWFPRHRIRFISLFHQPLDSFREPFAMHSIAVPIQGVMNENHCAETSEKVRKVFDIKRRNGDHIGSFAPFGYRKDPENRNALLIDKEAAGIVRDIFREFLGGMSRNRIARLLNERSIPCPAAYKQERLGIKYQNPHMDSEKYPLWSAGTVDGILKNRMYCGDMVQGRYRVKSYKVHIQEQVPEEEWYIVENTHEPIIERDTFEQASRLLREAGRGALRSGKTSLFGGLLYCADCRRAMARSAVKGRVYYYCRTYKEQSRTACTKHALKQEQLERAVLAALRQQIYLTADYMEMAERFDKMPLGEMGKKGQRDKTVRRKRELGGILEDKKTAYEAWKDGKIEKEVYFSIKEEYEKREAWLKDGKKGEENRREEQGMRGGTEEAFQAILREDQNITELSRELLVELIERIEVYEGREIRIIFRFSDAFCRHV